MVHGTRPQAAGDGCPETPTPETAGEAGTRRSMLGRVGLLAGAVGVTLLHGSEKSLAQTVGETVDIEPPAGNAALKLRPSGSVAPSTSAGGALNLDNSASVGAGAVLYSGQGASALGRLLVVNQDNPANPQNAVRIQNTGTASTVSILHDPAGGAGDSSAEALDIVSTNPLDTTLGVRGREEGRGTVKITHEKPARPDANASALSIALAGAGTAAQGIFIGNDAGNQTTGKLLNIRNGGPGTDRLVLSADGKLQLPVQGPSGGLVVGSDANLYRSAEGVLATDGGIAVADGVVLTAVDRTVADGVYAAAQVPKSTTVAIGAGGGLRGLKVAAAISVNGALAPTSLCMFNLSSAVTPAAKTDLNSVEVYKSSPQINGLSGVSAGVSGTTFSSFQHQLRLRPIASGTASFDHVYGVYVPPTNSVGAGWTVPDYAAVRIEAPGGTGSITQLVGIDIRDFRGRAANNYSLRSFGPAVHMRHSGGVSLGAQASPETLLHLRGNASVHGSLTVEAESANPPAPAPGTQARLYIKGGKLVIQWNRAGTVLYTTIALDCPGPYPAQSAVTTDTTAP
jgi:hyaluronidase-like protein HylP